MSRAKNLAPIAQAPFPGRSASSTRRRSRVATSLLAVAKAYGRSDSLAARQALTIDQLPFPQWLLKGDVESHLIIAEAVRCGRLIRLDSESQDDPLSIKPNIGLQDLPGDAVVASQSAHQHGELRGTRLEGLVRGSCPHRSSATSTDLASRATSIELAGSATTSHRHKSEVVTKVIASRTALRRLEGSSGSI